MWHRHRHHKGNILDFVPMQLLPLAPKWKRLVMNWMIVSMMSLCDGDRCDEGLWMQSKSRKTHDNCYVRLWISRHVFILRVIAFLLVEHEKVSSTNSFPAISSSTGHFIIATTIDILSNKYFYFVTCIVTANNFSTDLFARPLPVTTYR